MTFVHVKCPLEKLKEREIQRGDRDIGNAEGQFHKLYPDNIYDLVVDTDADSTENCAARVLSKHEQLLKGEITPSAFDRIRGE